MQVKTWKLTPQMMAAAWEHLKREAPIQGNNPSLYNSINRIDFQLPASAGFFCGVAGVKCCESMNEGCTC